MKLHNAIQQGLPNINTDLYKKCPASKYYLRLMKYKDRDKDTIIYGQKNDYDVLLCLYYNRKCVSNVVGKYNNDDNSMEIISTTNPEFEGNKFNLYLRTAFIYLMCFVQSANKTPIIKTIFSFSVNPTSTYTMYKYFHAYNKDLAEFVLENNLTPETFTHEDAKRFHEYYQNTHRITPEKAEMELNNMLEDVTMEELGWDSKEEAIAFIMEDMKNIETISLSVSLEETATIQPFLLELLSKINIGCDKTAGGTRKTKKKKTKKTRTRGKP